MKRLLMLVCVAVAIMAVVIMSGCAGVSSTQDTGLPAIPDHEKVEMLPPGVITPSSPSPTGAGTIYKGPSYMSGSEGAAKGPIESPK